MWKAVEGIIAEIKRCEQAGANMAAVAIAYVCIDTMVFLSMPSGQTSQTRVDFIAWVDTYLKGHSGQAYQYDGKDVYAARCSVLHAFGSEAEMHRKDNTIRKFGYHDGGWHALNPSVSPNLVIIGLASFLNDVRIAVASFLEACQKDATLRSLVEARLPTLLQTMPFPHGVTTPPRASP